MKNNFFRVNVYAERHGADNAFHRDWSFRQYPEQVVQLPFIPAPGDDYFPQNGWAGMEVKRRQVTANSDEITLIVEGSNWSYEDLESAGFRTKVNG